MNVALDKAKVSVKPGFGKIPDRPSFAKAGSVKAMFGTQETAAAQKTSSLKSTVSSNIATSSRSSVFSSRARSSSSTFVPATRFMNASDFKRDRTTTAAWGSIQGDHYIEGQTGVTKRSYRRMVQANQVSVAPQYQGRYTDFGNMYNQRMSFSDVCTLLTSGINTLFGGIKAIQGSGGTERGGGANPAASTAAASIQTAQTLAGNVGGIATATTTSELQAALSEAKTQQSDLQTLLNSDDYKNVETNLQTAKNDKTKIDAQVTEQQGIVSNQNKTIDLLSNTRIPAQETVVGNAEQALAKAQSMATPENPNDAAIRAAEQQLEQAKTTLQQLKDQLKTAEQTRDAAQQKLDGEDGLLAKQKQAENDIIALTSLQSDKQAKTTQLSTLEQTINNAEQRQEKMLQKEEKKLDGMFDDLKKLDEKIKNEKDDTKRTELKQEYSQLAQTFNSMAGASTSEKYQGASVSTDTTFTESREASNQRSLEQMRSNADEFMKKKNEEAMANLLK